MIKSMTGYGRGEAQGLHKQFTVEIKSVNHRYLEVFIRQPRQYAMLEENIRRFVQKFLQRGRIDIFIKVEELGEKKPEIKVDKEIAVAYHKSLKDLADNLQISPDINVFQLVSLPEVIKLEEIEDDIEQVWKILQIALAQGLEKLVEMRKTEGESLKKDLLQRVDLLHRISDLIYQRSPLVVEEYRQKLQNRIQDLLKDYQLDENRLNQEVVYFADKSSITEEIIRLRSHFQQFSKSMTLDEPVGRKLDFLVQEMNREMNTIGSKANDVEIAQLVVDGKSELEKIREQIQNIE